MRTFLFCALIFVTFRALGENDLSVCKGLFHPKVLTWYRHFNERPDRRFTFHAGQSISVGTTSYRIAGRLGAGGEGHVYLVLDGQRPFVAKIFKSRERFEIGLSDFERLSSVLPAVHAKNPSSNTLILEFREGVPIDVIAENGALLGLSQMDVDSIVRRWLEWAGRLNDEISQLGPHPFDFLFDVNALYSFKEDRFHLIDAR